MNESHPPPASSPRAGGVGIPVGWAVALVLALAAAMRIRLALTTPGWFPELYIVRVSSRPLDEVLQIAAADIHPPLQFVLRWAWSQIGGAGVLWHKSLSILAALGSMGLAFALAKRGLGARAGFMAVALLAANAAHLQYSQEIEEYALEWVLVAGMALAGWRWIEARGRGAAAAYVALALLAAINHYESLVVIVILAASGAAVLAREPRAAGEWALLNLAALALFLPFVPTMLAQLANEGGGRFFRFPSAEALATVWRGMGYVSRFALFPMLILSLVPLFSRETRRFAAFLWPLILLAPFATRFWVVILPREVLFTLPLWMILVAGGLERIPFAWARAALLLGLLALGVRSEIPMPRPSEVMATRRADRTLASSLGPGALLVHAEPHSLLYFAEYRPEYRNRLLMEPGAHLPFYEGGLGIPESLYITYGDWRREREAGVAWFGIRIDRALATRGQVWRAGAAAAESLAAAGDTLRSEGRITIWRSRAVR